MQQRKRSPSRTFHGRQGAKSGQSLGCEKTGAIHLQGSEIRRRVLGLRGQDRANAPEAPIAIPITAEKRRMISRCHAVIRIRDPRSGLAFPD